MKTTIGAVENDIIELAVLENPYMHPRPGSESIQVDSSRLDDPESSRFYSPQLLVLLTSVDFVSSRLENNLMYYRYFRCSLQYSVVSPKRNN